MSTLEFQKALIKLIKLPDHYRGKDLDEFLVKFDLTKSEQWQLRSLSASPYVKSFASLQRKKRFSENVMSVFSFGMRILGKEKSFDLYYNKFEPDFLNTPEDDKPREFIEFLRKQEFDLSANPWGDCISDILEYEYSEYLLYGSHLEAEWKVSPSSLLNPNKPFIIKDFDYGVVEYFEELNAMDEETKDDVEDPNAVDTREITLLPKKNPGTILFLKITLEDGLEQFEQFEINDDIKKFLQGQLKDSPDNVPSLPDFYNDLLEVGLVKSVH